MDESSEIYAWAYCTEEQAMQSIERHIGHELRRLIYGAFFKPTLWTDESAFNFAPQALIDIPEESPHSRQRWNDEDEDDEDDDSD